MVIKNVKIVNPNNSIAIANVHIHGSKIKKIEKVSGKAGDILIPGFIDLHIHGIAGYDVMDGPDALEAISKELASWGTTSFAPTLMTTRFEKILLTFKKINAVVGKGASIVGLHLEGPFISEAKKGAHDKKFLITPTMERIDKLIKSSNGRLKKIVIAPEVTNIKLVKYLKQNQIIASLGHSNARGQLVEKFVQAGANSATHLWNGMSGFENRNPGIGQIVLGANSVNAELICDFIHVDPHTLRLTIDYKTPDRIIAITDAIRIAKSNHSSGISGGLEVIRDGNALRVKESGVIAGGGSVMYEAFKNIIELGYSLNDAVKMTSHNQAREFHLNKGFIAAGKDADLLVLDKNLTIKQIIIGGKLWK